MIRETLCYLAVAGFSYYAWRNYYPSLCFAVLFMAVLEHPDMPKSIGGIQGLNPWNVLMLNVMLAWWSNRRREGRTWDTPRYIPVMLLMYLAVILWGFFRMIGDHEILDAPELMAYNSLAWSVSEYLVNCIKWVLPGILLFDACRTRRRVMVGLTVTLLVYFLLALQTIKHMPLGAVAEDGVALSKLANKLLSKSVGYHRVNLSMMFAGAAWAVLTTLTLIQKRRNQLLVIAAAATISLGQALTGGRTGYVTWGLIGTILCLVRWRKLFPILPATVIAVCIFLPGVRERMLMGFGGPSGGGVSHYEITSGRNIAWGYVIPKIHESPIFGHGRQAMVRTGIYHKIMEDFLGGETFPHPHNVYLECFLDNGLLGFMVIVPFYLMVLWHAFRILRDRSDPLFAAVGGAACALVLALLIAGMGSQSFYPREGSVGMWAAIGLLLRVSVERSRSQLWGTSLFQEDEEEALELGEASDSPAEAIPYREPAYFHSLAPASSAHH